MSFEHIWQTRPIKFEEKENSHKKSGIHYILGIWANVNDTIWANHMINTCELSVS